MVEKPWVVKPSDAARQLASFTGAHDEYPYSATEVPVRRGVDLVSQDQVAEVMEVVAITVENGFSQLGPDEQARVRRAVVTYAGRLLAGVGIDTSAIQTPGTPGEVGT